MRVESLRKVNMGFLTDNQKALLIFSYKVFNKTYDLEQEIREYAWKMNRDFLEKEYEKGVITKYQS